jgi:hypothetical protein
MAAVAPSPADHASEPPPSASPRTDVVEYGLRRVLVTVAVMLGAVVEIIDSASALVTLLLTPLVLVLKKPSRQTKVVAE